MALPFIIPAAIIALVAAVVVIAYLSWGTISDWFDDKKELKQADRDNIAVILTEKLKSGNFSTVQGIYNTYTNTFQDSVKYEAEDVDEQLKRRHKIIYEY
jgi:nitrogen fixation-related uncharacterized protein